MLKRKAGKKKVVKNTPVSRKKVVKLAKPAEKTKKVNKIKMVAKTAKAARPRKKPVVRETTSKQLIKPKKASPSVVRYVTGAVDLMERRRAARLDVPLKVQYKLLNDKNVKEGATRNISASGCLVLMEDKYPVGSLLELKIFFDKRRSKPLALDAKIVRLNRAEGGLHEYGMAFNKVEKEQRKLFADFCFTKMYERIGLLDWSADKGVKV